MNDALALRHKISGSSSIQRSRKIGHLKNVLKQQSSILKVLKKWSNFDNKIANKVANEK